MGFFDCCIKCKPPKRYPGCSGKCPEYAKGRERLEECKAREKLRKDLDRYYKEQPNN